MSVTDRDDAQDPIGCCAPCRDGPMLNQGWPQDKEQESYRKLLINMGCMRPAFIDYLIFLAVLISSRFRARACSLTGHRGYKIHRLFPGISRASFTYQA